MSWTLLAELDSPTSGSFDFTGLSLNGFTAIQVVGAGITVTTDGSVLAIRFYVGGVEQSTAGLYRWGIQAVLSSNATNNDGDTSDPQGTITSNDASYTIGNATNEWAGFVVTVDDPASTTLYKKIASEVVGVNASGNVMADHAIGIMQGTGAIDGIKVFGGSNLTAGQVRLLGRA